ncbi:MAG: D-amino-acid transaminase [Pseudomonadota bacterium]
MTRIVYVNGEYLPEDEAKISVFDRGFLFADGVYEVTSVMDGKLIDFEGHYERLKRSMRELDMGPEVDRADLLEIHRQLVERNAVTEGLVYLQVTRGAPAMRDFVFPPEDTPLTMVLFTQLMSLTESPKAAKGIRVKTIPDQRWARCDIKTVQLLYPSLGKSRATKDGVDDAWMVADGEITEGTSNNAYIVTKAGHIVTRPVGHDILNGITRKAVLRMAEEAQMLVEERAVTVDEAKDATEARDADDRHRPVTGIHGVELGDGTPGLIARRLREIYIEESLKTAL